MGGEEKEVGYLSFGRDLRGNLFAKGSLCFDQVIKFLESDNDNKN